MTRRERLENKVARRQEWAEKAAQRSTASFNHAHNLVKDIPLGQPILIGHHSERAHRRVIDRMGAAMDKGCELSNKAEMHESKAANLDAMLDKAIFSDDSDAIEAIQARIEANEASREKMKKINALYRKGDAAGLAALGIDLDTLKAKLAQAGGYWGSAPHLPYEMSNLGGRIQADKKRIEHIKCMNQRKERAEAAGGVAIARGAQGYAQVTFAEKPEYSIIRALKDADFHWSGGSWFGTTAKLPESVAALEAQAVA